jgi:hypothetical protein
MIPSSQHRRRGTRHFERTESGYTYLDVVKVNGAEIVSFPITCLFLDAAVEFYYSDILHQRILHLQLSSHDVLTESFYEISKFDEWSPGTATSLELIKPHGYAVLDCWPKQDTADRTFLRRVLLDFLYDMTREHTFEFGSAHKCKAALLASPYINAILKKAEFYWTVECEKIFAISRLEPERELARALSDKRINDARFEFVDACMEEQIAQNGKLCDGKVWLGGLEEEVKSALWGVELGSDDSAETTHNTENVHKESRTAAIEVSSVSWLRRTTEVATREVSWFVKRKRECLLGWGRRNWHKVRLKASARDSVDSALAAWLTSESRTKQDDTVHRIVGWFLRRYDFNSGLLLFMQSNPAALAVARSLQITIGVLLAIAAYYLLAGSRSIGPLDKHVVVYGAISCLALAVFFVTTYWRPDSKDITLTRSVGRFPFRWIMVGILLVFIVLMMVEDLGGWGGGQGLDWISMTIPWMPFLLAGVLVSLSFRKPSVVSLVRMANMRLVGTLAVAWLAIAVTDEWSKILVGWKEILLFGIPTLGLTYMFALVEMRIRVPDNPSKRRAFALVLYGFLLSLFIGSLTMGPSISVPFVSQSYLRSDVFQERAREFGMDRLPKNEAMVFSDTQSTVDQRLNALRNLSWGIPDAPLAPQGTTRASGDGIRVLYYFAFPLNGKAFLTFCIMPGFLILSACFVLFGAMVLQLFFQEKVATDTF